MLKANNLFYNLFALVTFIGSYFLGYFYYNSNTGLDFNRYFLNIQFLNGKNVEILDSQGTAYFYIISKYIYFLKGNLFNEYSINDAIQSVNFIFYLIGVLGLYRLLVIKGIKKNDVLYSLSILNFLPTGFYFRLTMKPEVMAFAILPWLIIFINKYLLNKNNKNIFALTLISSFMLTLKASITGMILLIILVYYFDEFKKIKNHTFLIFCVSTSVGVLTSLNYFITKRWLFSRPYQNVDSLRDRWDNKATLDIFYNIDFQNLLENPFKHLHADSLISITLIDTLSDYFTFFWNHKEIGNYFALNRIEFSDNFLIQAFLPQYISIIFTAIFYLVTTYLFFKKNFLSKDLIFPHLGLVILAINSLGIPSTNFDPTTGDIFKVHYYSFLFAYSFVFLLTYFLNKYSSMKILFIFLIPIFFLAMGFPKSQINNFQEDRNIRIENSEFCQIFSIIEDLNCS